MRRGHAAAESDQLTDYHLFHAIRAELLQRLGRSVDAAIAYDAAIASTENASERDFLERNRSQLE